MSDKNGLPTGKHTLVEEGTEFKGTMSSSCPIVVMGKVEGDIAGPVIHITPSGVVAGVVKVKDLHSAGELAGEVEAETVQISGRVRDRTVIRARSLARACSAWASARRRRMSYSMRPTVRRRRTSSPRR